MDPVRQFYQRYADIPVHDFYSDRGRAVVVTIEEGPMEYHDQLFRHCQARRALLPKYQIPTFPTSKEHY